jgi:hypothetical protein
MKKAPESDLRGLFLFLSREGSGRLVLFPALLARDVLVRAGQLAAADVAEQLL